MLQFPGVSVSVQQSSNEGPFGHNFFSLSKSFVRIWNTDVGENLVPCDISSHVTRSVRKSATSFTLHSSLDFFGLPGLGSLIRWHVLHENEYPNRNLCYCPLSSHHKLHARQCEFLWGFCHVKFQSWCAIFDHQPSQYLRCLQTPCLKGQFKAVYTREVTNVCAASSNLQL
jgi:hypothetical protein